ncbi:ccr4 associated factor [Neophaeococcomyces mojaviensis]|uniref:Ccr4 associated factor n=1 Tax=Neophaeococcomyces mojaviensis TaxID=3383035 RepID=A0ACC3A442_9EURO|nr:ccr4 associated factor [Knufia sp. JES_112]
MAIQGPTRTLMSSACWRCQIQAERNVRRFASIQNKTQARRNSNYATPKQWLPYYPIETQKACWIQLKNRTLIRIGGPDATDFLHNLIPAPVLPLDDKTHIIFSAFLNAKGRIIHDVFVYKPAKDGANEWLLDVDTNSAPAVVSHLKKHKLRSKFKLEKLSPEEAAVMYVWPRADQGEMKLSPNMLLDPRPGMGMRVYTTAVDETRKTFTTNDSAQELKWEDYMIHRMLNGLAEGPVEIASGSALPQESNIDFCGGIDFHKGCYLGQELTIRTHHTGIVRKRILPVQIYTDDDPISHDQTAPIYNPSLSLPQPPNEANISKCGAKGRSGRSTGKWLGGYGNIGLALCRLETMTDLSLTAEGSQYNPETDEFEVSWDAGQGENDAEGQSKKTSVKVKAFVPPWLRQGIENTIKARNDRSQARRRQAEEDEEDEVD